MILLALGANLPGPHGRPPLETCRAAVARFKDYGFPVAAVSRWYGSPAYPEGAGPDFVNGVARVETSLSPEALLDAMHALEAAFGRVRGRPNAPRRLDLDLLDYNGCIRQGPGLVLPHPRLHERGFVLLPLTEVAPDWRHPVTGQTIADLIAALPPDQRTWPLPGQ